MISDETQIMKRWKYFCFTLFLSEKLKFMQHADKLHWSKDSFNQNKWTKMNILKLNVYQPDQVTFQSYWHFMSFYMIFNRSISNLTRRAIVSLCYYCSNYYYLFSLFLYQFCYMIESICLIAYKFICRCMFNDNALTERYKKKCELFQCFFLLFEEKTDSFYRFQYFCCFVSTLFCYRM